VRVVRLQDLRLLDRLGEGSHHVVGEVDLLLLGETENDLLLLDESVGTITARTGHGGPLSPIEKDPMHLVGTAAATAPKIDHGELLLPTETGPTSHGSASANQR
jgi:hypothetical protein